MPETVIADAGFLGTPCVLETPAGDIDYWVSFPAGYGEHWETDANQISARLVVAWDDAADFKAAAMGSTKKFVGSSFDYFDRTPPLRCPYTDGLYLSSMRLAQFGVNGGADQRSDEAFDNWPAADWCHYDCMFTNRPYEIVAGTEFNGLELSRYVQRQERFVPRERIISGGGYETFEATRLTIGDERQFVPYYEYEFIYTWYQIPIGSIPRTAIKACALRVNGSAFDAGGLGAPAGGFAAGDVLFKGYASPFVPYRGPDGAWYVDISYLFGYQPADGSGDGWNKVPKKDSTWIRVVVRNSGTFPGTPGTPLYFTPSVATGGAYTADFAGLFRPEP